jgi:hypothetical protein
MTQRSAIAVLDAILVRGLIPLWILAGAMFKLVERNPGNLPSIFREFAARNDLTDWLNPFMRVAIGIEILAAALMIFVPRISRIIAVAMLTFFCAILVAEIARKQSSCGCMGAVNMSPTTMLAIDGVLLLGAIALGVIRRMNAHENASLKVPGERNNLGLVTASVVGVIGFVVAIALPERTVVEENGPGDGPPQIADDTPTDGASDGATQPRPPVVDLPPGTIANPNPTPLSGFYLISSPDAWVGKPATEIDLIKLMRLWPDDIATGTRHIIFYSRTCDHCEGMFHDHLALPHDRPITAVEIPFDRRNMRGPSPWDMPEVDVQHLALPLGPDWVMTPPIIITIENGVVSCAAEAEYEGCLGVEPTHVH